MILDASHDGFGRVAEFAGGPSVGDLIDGLNPAPATHVYGGAFYNEIVLLLEDLTRFDCNLEPTEEPPAAGRPMSEVALYGLDGTGSVMASTDPLGANALAALDITGVPGGGELSVFYPLTFIAPDTLFLDLDAPPVAVEVSPARDRLRLVAISPNPATGSMDVAFGLPSAGSVAVRAGYGLSQKQRKRIEEVFGWTKTIGLMRKVRHRGTRRVGWIFTFTLAAYNLVRIRNLMAVT